MDKESLLANRNLLMALKSYIEVEKILSTFITALLSKSAQHVDDVSGEFSTYLHGSFNLGGTRSGRLSSSNPNLTNIPSTGTKYAKHIKQCFSAPKGWVMVGADFTALEDVMAALLTKDPFKLAPYTNGYDSHCLRAYAYYKDQMPDILQATEQDQCYQAEVDGKTVLYIGSEGLPANAVPISWQEFNVGQINSIQTKYKSLRQASKTVSFALQYGGTWKTLVTNCGLSEYQAKEIEARYHELYKVADAWTQQKLEKASRLGYAELAFGLRLQTPILKQIILSAEQSMPWEAHKEMKTAANALVQSYGLLNTRATTAFMQKVWSSPFAKEILPIAQIHDATYFVARNRLEVLHFINKELIEEMEWNDIDDIKHPQVRPSAQLELFWPDWNSGIKLPTNTSMEELHQFLTKHFGKS